MKIKEWKSLWRFDRTVNIPHLSATLMSPWAFARLCWYFNRREFQAWPSEYETSLVLGWRLPFTKKFKEKKWATVEKMPLAIYGPSDLTYLQKVAHELGLPISTAANIEGTRYLGPTIREILQREPKCAHNYWIASCPNCARKALLQAVAMKGEFQGDTKTVNQREAERLVAQGTEREAAHKEALKEAKRLGIPEWDESPLEAFRRHEAEAKARLGSGE